MKKLITTVAIAFCLTANAQTISTFAGNGTNAYNGDGGQATAASMGEMLSVIADKNGNIFFTDLTYNVVRKISTSGIITTVAGTGAFGFSGDGGMATAAKLNGTRVIAVDKAGNLYLEDTGNYRVRKINTAGVISTVVGNGIVGYSGDGGMATAASIDFSEGITVDTVGNIYVADETHGVIRKINTNGIISTFAGSGTQGYSGDNGPATNAQLALQGITADNKGNLFIADEGNRVIRKVDANGIITTIAGTGGVAGFSGDGGAATLAELSGAGEIAIDAGGNVYISDFFNSRIRYVNASGIISTIAGNGTPGYAGDNGPALQAEFGGLAGVCIYGNHLYIADFHNYRIREVTFAAPEGISPYSNFTNQLTLYPNPNKGSFTIELNSEAKQTLQIFDVNGKLVLTQTISGKTNIDATNLAEGVYNLNLISNQGVANKRLVIVR
jgi:hypothetical protein